LSERGHQSRVEPRSNQRPAVQARSGALSQPLLLQRKCACAAPAGLAGSCARCEHEQRAPSLVHEVLREPGQALDGDTRRAMEAGFGHDFSRVRVHADARAGASARAVDAQAYTVGRDIVFAPGAYQPRTAHGQRLLAHEMAHTLQQGQAAGAPATLQVARADSSHEQQADSLAAQALNGTTNELGNEPGNQLGNDPNHDLAPRGRVSAVPPQLAREPDALKKHFAYDRSEFGDRFDAYVDKVSHTVTLIMGVDFTLAGWPGHTPEKEKEKAAADFKTRFKSVIQSTWGGVYALQSACHGNADKFEAKVRIDLDSTNPHVTIYLHPDTPGGRSGAADGQSAMQVGDVFAKERTRLLPDAKGKPKEHTFHQVTAAHEFGHLIGLQHIHCKGNEEQCYGMTPQAAADIMGSGSVVSQRDYRPFVKIMERYGKDAKLPEGCNSWKLVAPG